MVSSLVCKLSGGIKEYQLGGNGSESILRYVTHLRYLVFLPKGQSSRHGTFCPVLVDSKDWDQCPEGITGQNEGKQPDMELDESGETVHKAKCFGEPAELMHKEVGRGGIS